MAKIYTVLIEQDEDGIFIGKVPELKGCATQGRTIDELMENVKEAISLYLEVNGNKDNFPKLKFVGLQQVEVI
jgi:predicted RNase H-like HicB family nuclease